MGRRPCCSKEEVKRGPWTAQEDEVLADYIKSHGEGKWRNVPKEAGLKRCGKSCRLRWLNYLRPNIKRDNITQDEEDLIIRLHKLLGNRWSLIAGRIPGRTENEIKNYWNSNLFKKPKGNGDQNHPSTTSPSPSRTSIEALELPVQQSKAHDKLSSLVSIMASESGASDGSLSLSTTTNEEDYSSDILMDFYMREMSLSEFLDTDFAMLSNVFGVCDMNKDGGTHIVEGRGCDDSSQKAHADSGFGSHHQLAAFTDSSDEWIM